MYCNCDVDVDFGIGVYAIVKNQDGRDDDVNMARDDLLILIAWGVNGGSEKKDMPPPPWCSYNHN